eukprot:COSAG02_NODE_30171_length_556_cov_0.700219_1_plen_126_part_00
MIECLECSARLLPVVSRQQRAALMKRVDSMQDSLESSEQTAPWVRAEWTTEQCEDVRESMARLVSLEDSQEAGHGPTVTSAVTGLLTALDNVSESFVDRAEVLLAALRDGGEAGAGARDGIHKNS